MGSTRFIMITGWAHGTDIRLSLSTPPAGKDTHPCIDLSAILPEPNRDENTPAPIILTLPDLHPDPSKTANYAAELTLFMGRNGTPVTLIGWSTGAMIALTAAAQKPELVERLILISATARFCRSPDYPHGLPPANLRALRRQLQHAPRTALADFFTLSNAPLPIPHARISKLTDKAMEQGLPQLAAGLNYLGKTDLRPLLPQINTPTLLIHGRQDRVIPPGAADYLAEHLPDARLVMHDAGHALPACKSIASYVSYFT